MLVQTTLRAVRLVTLGALEFLCDLVSSSTVASRLLRVNFWSALVLFLSVTLTPCGDVYASECVLKL